MLDVGRALVIRHVRICAILHVYKPKVNDFVLAPTAREDFWRDSAGRTILPHGTFGQTILPVRACRESTGSEKSMASHHGAAKVWFQTGQDYGSRHNCPTGRSEIVGLREGASRQKACA